MPSGPIIVLGEMLRGEQAASATRRSAASCSRSSGVASADRAPEAEACLHHASCCSMPMRAAACRPGVTLDVSATAPSRRSRSATGLPAVPPTSGPGCRRTTLTGLPVDRSGSPSSGRSPPPRRRSPATSLPDAHERVRRRSCPRVLLGRRLRADGDVALLARRAGTCTARSGSGRMSDRRLAPPPSWRRAAVDGHDLVAGLEARAPPRASPAPPRRSPAGRSGVASTAKPTM